MPATQGYDLSEKPYCAQSSDSPPGGKAADWVVMRVIQTIAGTQERHGGTSRSVPALADALAGAGLDVHLVTGFPAGNSVACNLPGPGVTVHRVQESAVFGRGLTGASFRRQIRALVNTAETPCVIHDHGVWLISNHAAAVAARQSQTPRIVSPRGMLSTWALNHGRWKKRIAWRLFQASDLRLAAGFHATSQQEADELRRLGFRQPVAVIPNGISCPAGRSVVKGSGVRRVLFLSRIHPKKGLLNLVQAWSGVPQSAGWRLVIAGPDEHGHQLEVERAAVRLGVRDQIDFIGSVADSAKWDVYGSAELFVLPSFSENFGIVVAEAMAAGLPVIASTGTPWDCLPQVHAGWWVDPDVASLGEALRTALSLTAAELAGMGQAAAAYSRRRFSWRQAADEMRDYYCWLLGAGERQPACVQLADG